MGPQIKWFFDDIDIQAAVTLTLKAIPDEGAKCSFLTRHVVWSLKSGARNNIFRRIFNHFGSADPVSSSFERTV